LHHNSHVFALFLAFFRPLDVPALVDDSFEQALQPVAIEWPRVHFLDPLQDLAFPFRIIDAEIERPFQLSDFDGAF